MSLWALALALISQSLATGWATEVFVRKNLAAGLRRSWMVMAVAAMLLALYHGYTLELALRTGLVAAQFRLYAANAGSGFGSLL